MQILFFIYFTFYLHISNIIPNFALPPRSMVDEGPELNYVHREWMGSNESLEQLITALKKQVSDIYYSDSESNYDRFRIVFYFDN